MGAIGVFGDELQGVKHVQSAMGSRFRLSRVLLAAAALALVWFFVQLFFGASPASAEESDGSDSGSVTDLVSQVTDAVKDDVTDPVTDVVDTTTSEVVDVVDEVADAVRPPAAESEPPAEEQAPPSDATPPSEPSTPPADASDEGSGSAAEGADQAADPARSTDSPPPSDPLTEVTDSAIDAVDSAVSDTPVADVTAPLAATIDSAVDPLISAVPLAGNTVADLVGGHALEVTIGAVTSIVDPLVADVVDTTTHTTTVATHTVGGVVSEAADAVAVVTEPLDLGPADVAQSPSLRNVSERAVPSLSGEAATGALHKVPRGYAAVSPTGGDAEASFAGVDATQSASAADAPLPIAPPALGAAAVGSAALSAGSAGGAGTVADSTSANATALGDGIRSGSLDDDDLPESLTLTLTCSPD